jgi:hypothetical protein
VHPVPVLEVADHRLDGGAAAHLAADGGGDAADLARDPDAEAVGMVVAAIAFIDMDAADLDAGEGLDAGDDGSERMAVVGIAVQRLGVEDELAALRLGHRRGDRDLAAELVGSLTLADALDLGSVQGIELPAALALPLLAPRSARDRGRRRPL